MSRPFQTLDDHWRYASAGERRLIVVLASTLVLGQAYLLAMGLYVWALYIVLLLASGEWIARMAIVFLSKRSNFITLDETPEISRAVVEKFYEHGYDAELGWARKANTAKVDLGIPYEIDERGSRRNSGHEAYPLVYGTYGDSYVFCRECADTQTWQWYLSEFTQKNVLNFGVGNYGLDQTLIRLKRQYPRTPTPVVIVGVVPQTIARNLSTWKHYNEYGNVLAFKPRFVRDDGRLRLIPNPIDSREKFFRLREYLPEINKYDYFYERKYKKEASRFPFLLSAALDVKRVVLAPPVKWIENLSGPMGSVEGWCFEATLRLLKNTGVRQSAALFQDEEAVGLLKALVKAFCDYAEKEAFIPVFVMLPMKEDLYFLRRYYHFYEDFLRDIKESFERVVVIDGAEALLGPSAVPDFFAKWHYNPEGNRLIARLMADRMADVGVASGSHGKKMMRGAA